MIIRKLPALWGFKTPWRLQNHSRRSWNGKIIQYSILNMAAFKLNYHEIQHNISAIYIGGLHQ